MNKRLKKLVVLNLYRYYKWFTVETKGKRNSKKNEINNSLWVEKSDKKNFNKDK